ncbi:MAG TPA: DUF4105 domain-containing protein [Phycisphaerales bacterium]|nr:DUF4105 domain-containing protein [Phycisphaerales bacterium]HMP36407.1 DUF4105 domain-containing protein [Phycisphaerales bacterium]
MTVDLNAGESLGQTRARSPERPGDAATTIAGRLLDRLGRALFVMIAGAALLAAGAWAIGALVLVETPMPTLRKAIAVAVGIGAIIAAIQVARGARGRALVPAAVALLAILGWYRTIEPSNDRSWLPDVARIPSARIEGDVVTVENVRNFTYRSRDDFDQVWETRQFRLSELDSLWLVMSFWGPRYICHTFVSFGFEDGSYISMSIETRKRQGQHYSAIRGLFRVFGLAYVIADERDLIGVRTNIRREDVYLYRIPIEPLRLRGLFIDYLDGANQLAKRPEWYNAVTNSCGINVLYAFWSGERTHRFNPKLLLNGLWDYYAWQSGNLGPGMTFGEVRAAAAIDALAREGDAGAADTGFSRRIRTRPTDEKDVDWLGDS